MSEARPDLSMVIAWQESQADPYDCLSSLYHQEHSYDVELILAYGGFKPELETLKQQFPRILIIEHPSSGSIPSLHGIGVSAARGNLISITEAHTTFSPNWIDTAISIGRSSTDAATGGAVEPGTKLSELDYALYLCDYAQFALPLENAPSDDLPGNNIVFKRDVIERNAAGSDLSREGFWKTFFCNKLLSEGERLSRNPAMVAYYNRHLEYEDVMTRRYHHGRCFGSMRSESFPPVKRLLYGVSSAVLLPILANRLAKKVSLKPSLTQRASQVQWLCCLIILSWIRGELIGTVFGAGDSCSKL